MKLLVILLVVMSWALNVNSQNKIEVEGAVKETSLGPKATFTVLIPESKVLDIENRWKKYVNNRTVDKRVKNFTTQVGNVFKSKDKKTRRNRLTMDKKRDELHIRSIELGKISSSPMDVYAIITQMPEGCQLIAFFQYTDSVFIDPSNTDDSRLNLIADFVSDFGVKAYRNVVDENIKTANRELSREESVLKELNASTLRAEKSISRYETLIQEYNSRIAILRNDSANLIESIDLKKQQFSEIPLDSTNYKKTKAELKFLEKERAKYPRDIRTLTGKIKSKELEIQSARNQIAQNELEIKNQEAVIREKQQIAEELIKEKGEIQQQ